MSFGSPSGEPGGPPAGEFEVIIVRPRRELWRRRLRSAGRTSLVSLRRARHFLTSPDGRRLAANGAVAAVTIAAAAGGFVLVRRWMNAARGGMAAVAAIFRTAAGVFGEVGRVLNSTRWLLPLRGIWRALRWGGLASTLRLYRFCPDCHARIHHDANVCYRCGCRPGGPVGRGRRSGSGFRRGVRAVRWAGRVVFLRLYRPCPDCHRLLHADARVCWRCGFRLRTPR